MSASLSEFLPLNRDIPDFPKPGIVFKDVTPLLADGEAFAAAIRALRAGEINAAWTTTADPAVPDDVVVLTDRKPMLIPAENAVPLYRRNELTARQVLAINEIAGVLDTAALKRMRQQIADGTDPRTVAEAWLAENPLGR